jgi:hypothetical protein
VVVHHRNGNHHRTDIEMHETHPDNHPGNLITLCRKCHSDLTHLARVPNQDLLFELLSELR